MKRDGVFQRKDSPGFYVSYVDAKGVRRKKKVQASTRRQALDVLAAIKTAVQREEILGIKEVSGITTADAMKRYLRHQKTRLTAETYERQEGIVAMLVKELPKQLKSIDRQKVTELVDKRTTEVSPATVHKEIGVLKRALTLCIEWELITLNHSAGVALPAMPEGRTRYLTPLEFKKALEEAPEWAREPIAFPAFTGMRRGEVVKFRWPDADLAGKRGYLPDTKNGGLRVVPLNRLAMQILTGIALRKLKARGYDVSNGLTPKLIRVVQKWDELVFTGFTKQNLSVVTRRLFARLKMEGASYHTLRHTAASWLAMQGVPLYDIGQILGHKTPRMTTRYAHLSPDYKANSISKIEQALLEDGGDIAD